jgi:hypothetical protein
MSAMLCVDAGSYNWKLNSKRCSVGTESLMVKLVILDRNWQLLSSEQLSAVTGRLDL